MNSILDIAAQFLNDDTNPIMESFHDESVDQARKYIEKNYDELYALRGLKERQPEKPANLKAFAAKKVRDIQGKIIYPFNYGTRKEFKWLDSYVLGLVRIMYKDLFYDKPRFKSNLVSDLRKVYFTAVYARQDGIKNNDKSLMMDKNMNGMSFEQLKTKFMPLYDHYIEIYNKNKKEYIENKRGDGQQVNTFNAETDAKYDGAGYKIDHFDEPYHENSFRIGKYNACMIPTHKAAASWNMFTNKTSDSPGCNWCITIPKSSEHWNGYGCGKSRTVYFCWTDNFMNLNVRDFNDGSAPYNEWGKSLICIMVNNSNDINKFIIQVTSRYNHCDGKGNSAPASLGFGDDFCGEAETEGLVYKLVEILGCTPEEAKEKFVFEGTTTDEAEDNATNFYARAMDNIEYYVNQNRFTNFDIIKTLPDNYTLLSHDVRIDYDDITVNLLMKNNKPIPDFMFARIEPLFVGKTIDDCVFEVKKSSYDDCCENIIIGAEPECYFDHDFYQIIPLYRYQVQYSFEHYDVDDMPQNRLILCNIRNDGKYNVYDLDKKEFLFDNMCYIKSTFVKDGHINFVISESYTITNLSQFYVYDVTTGKSHYIKNEYLAELEARTGNKAVDINKCYVYVEETRELLFNLYDMKPIESGYGVYIAHNHTFISDYILAYNEDSDDDVYNVFYKGEKVGTFDSRARVELLKYNTKNPDVAIFSYNYDKAYSVYNKGKLIYEESNNNFNSSLQPYVIGKILYVPIPGDTLYLHDYDHTNHKLINIDTKEVICQEFYIDNYFLSDVAMKANKLVLGAVIDENRKIIYKIADANGNVHQTKEKYSDDTEIANYGILSSGDCNIIILDGSVENNKGDGNVLIQFATFNSNSPIIYKDDGTLFYKPEDTIYDIDTYDSIAPLGYGFWLLTMRAKLTGYGYRYINILLDKDGNKILGGKTDVMTSIEIQQHFSKNTNLEVTYTEYDKHYNSYQLTISKDGNVSKSTRNESYIQNLAAYLL